MQRSIICNFFLTSQIRQYCADIVAMCIKVLKKCTRTLVITFHSENGNKCIKTSIVSLISTFGVGELINYNAVKCRSRALKRVIEMWLVMEIAKKYIQINTKHIPEAYKNRMTTPLTPFIGNVPLKAYVCVCVYVCEFATTQTQIHKYFMFIKHKCCA